MAGGILTILGGSVLFWLIIYKPALTMSIKWGIMLVAGIVVLYLGTIYLDILGVKTINPSEEERAVYEFIATLPKDTVLAGDPDIMTNIPLFSKRSVLFRGLFQEVMRPLLNILMLNTPKQRSLC